MWWEKNLTKLHPSHPLDVGGGEGSHDRIQTGNCEWERNYKASNL